MILFKKNLASRSFFVSKRANERFAKKKRAICHLLFYHEHPERIAHSHSFVMSNLSNLLKVTLLS